ncbi:MAG: hypothetical protein IJQ25_10175 [Oscillibacter sp.]|nr:hypothetical protein [Oscillibacter sp.]
MADGTGQGAVVKGGSRAIVAVVSVLVVALVGVIVALVMVLNRGEKVVYVEEEPMQRTRVVSEDNVQEVVENAVDLGSVRPGYYEVSMNMNWIFPDGASPSSNAFVENVPGNKNDVYFDVQLRDTGETVYESPLIPRGEQLASVQLNRDLDAGEYDCIIIYHLVDDEQRTVSTLSLGMLLTIES